MFKSGIMAAMVALVASVNGEDWSHAELHYQNIQQFDGVSANSCLLNHFL